MTDNVVGYENRKQTKRKTHSMSSLIQAGSKKSAASTTKTKRDATPKLVCLITGDTRFTNKEYLETKSRTAGSVARFLKHYICAAAMKMLRAGKTVQEVRSSLKKGSDLPAPSAEVLKVAMETNGKRAKKVKAPKPAKTKSKAKGKPATPAAPKPASPAAAPQPPAPQAPSV